MTPHQAPPRATRRQTVQHGTVRRMIARLAISVAVAATVSVAAPQVALASNGRASMALVVSTVAGVSSVPFGTPVTVSVEMGDVSGSCISWRDCDSPAGKVAFYDNDVYIGTKTLVPLGGSYSSLHKSDAEITWTPLNAGAHHFRALYAGDFDSMDSDVDFQAIGNSRPDLTVTKAECTLGLSDPVPSGSDSVTFTADLGKAEYAGTIDFLLGGSLYGRQTLTDHRSATFSFSALQYPSGTYTFHAVYYGDANHLTCTSGDSSYTKEPGTTGSGEVVYPQANSDSYEVDMNTSIKVYVLTNDRLEPAYPVKPEIVPPADGGATLQGTALIDQDSPLLTYTPPPGFTGTDTLTYRLVSADDGTPYGDSANVSFNVGCRAVGHADSYNVVPGTALVTAAPGVLGNDQACGGGATVADAPEHGTLTLDQDGGFTYTPDDDFTGLDTFTYTLDKDTARTPVKVLLAVNPSNCAVNLADDEYATTGILVRESPGLASNDTLCGNAIDVVQQPAHGSVVIAPGGGFTYTPASGYSGPDSFTYGLVAVPDAPEEKLRGGGGAFVAAVAPAPGPTATVHLAVTSTAVTTTAVTTTTTSSVVTTSTSPAPATSSASAPSAARSTTVEVRGVSNTAAAAPTTTVEPAALASTGAPSAPMLAAALELILAGVALVGLARRRRRAD